MRIRKIAEICGYEICGTDCEIRTISYADAASEDSLAIIRKEKEIFSTGAGAVLTEPRFVQTDKTVLMVTDPLDVAAVKVAKLLVENGDVKLYDKPAYSNVNGFFIAPNATIGENTIITPNVFIGEDVRIGSRCRIDPNVQIRGGSVIGNGVHIATGSVVGADAFSHYYDTDISSFSGIGRAVIEDNVEIGCHTVIQRGTFSDTLIGKGSKIGNLIDIGHDVRIGYNCKIVSQTGIAGYVIIGNEAVIYGQTGIANHVKVGDRAVVMAQSLVTKDVRASETVSGRYARKHVEELKKQAKIDKLCEVKKWEIP